MLEEFNPRQVNTPGVKSRKDAWAAWEAFMLSKYSKFRKKIEAKKDKALAAFASQIEGEYHKLYMYIHDTRPRREEVKVELMDGEFVWVSLREAMRTYTANSFRIHPNFEFYRRRQDYFCEMTRPEGRDNIGRFIFQAGFHNFELTPEELKARELKEAAELASWMEIREQQLKIQITDEYRRAIDEQRNCCQQLENTIHNDVAIWNTWPRPITGEQLAKGGAAARIFYLIAMYDVIDQLTLKILAESLCLTFRDQLPAYAEYQVALILGYEGDDAWLVLNQDVIPNLNKLQGV